GDEFSVFVRQWYSDSYYGYSGIWISTSSSDPIANPGDFTELWEAGSGFAEGSWEEVIIDIEAYAGQTVHFAFKYEGQYDHEFYVDRLYVGTACDVPIATATAIPACETNSFNVELDVTSLGTASNLTITDNLGNAQTVSSTGTVTFGPYDSGSTATFTMADEANPTCNALVTATYLCPPSNDNCETATMISVFPYSEAQDASGATQSDFVTCGV